MTGERDDGEIRKERDALLDTFNAKRTALTEELSQENERLRMELAALEDENTALRAEIATESAIRELLKTLNDMQAEKQQLEAHMGASRAAGSRLTSRFAELERELEQFVNLFVATHQLHSSLRPTTVIRQLREIMLQLIGVRSLAIFLLDETGHVLVPVACDGIHPSEVSPIDLNKSGPEQEAPRIVSAWSSRKPQIMEGDMRGASLALPSACIPMNLDDRAVGMIVMYDLLGHKSRFSSVDFELIKLLSKNAGPALLAAHLFVLHEAKVPNLAALREVLM